jgi:Fusaric acid resistance protein-like
MWRDSLRDSFRFDPNGLLTGRALRCSVALLLLLLLGYFLGEPKLILFPVVGAFVVGFAPLKAMGGSHATPMLAAAVGMALTSWLGALAGATTFGSIAALFLAGQAFGLMSGLGSATNWVSLQCLVFLVLLGLPYPADGRTMALRALSVLGGGLLQMCLLSFFRVVGHFEGDDRWLHPVGHMAWAAKARMRALRRQPLHGFAAWEYGFRIAMLLIAAYGIGRWFDLPRYPWALMTGAIVFRPDFRQTLTRGLARCIGTLLGAAVATAVVALCQPGAGVLCVLVVVSAFFAYQFLYANYAVCTLFITGFVVFLLSFEGLPGLEMVHWRIVATLLGGALAFLAWVPWKRDNV